MQCGRFVLALALQAVAAPGYTQNIDPAPRDEWSKLSRLATEIAELEACAPAKEDGPVYEQFWVARDKKVAEYVIRVESYAVKYANTRTRYESVQGFKYRVWSATLKEGAARAKKADGEECVTRLGRLLRE